MADDLHRKQRVVCEGWSAVVVNHASHVRRPAKFRARTNPVCGVYTSPVGAMIKSHGVRYHQYANDTLLHIAMRTANTTAGLYILADCTMDVKHWYLLNGLQLNADKSEVMFVGTAYQLPAASAIKAISVTGSSLSLTNKIKTLGVVLDSRLTFESLVSSVIQ